MKRSFIILSLLLGITLPGTAQDDFDDFDKGFEDFVKSIEKDFEDFRQQCIDEYNEFLRNPWKEFEKEKPRPKPIEEDVPPVVAPIEDDKPIETNPQPIKDVIPVVPPQPQPQPVAPIEDTPAPHTPTVSFEFFGTDAEVRWSNDMRFRIASISEDAFADALNEISSSSEYDNLLYDCLKIRKELALSDWAYLLMLDKVAASLYGKDSNEATLLVGYLYMQSGYRMCYGHDGYRLYMLYASRHTIYEKSYYKRDGYDFYVFGDNTPERMFLCSASFPKEESLSLYIHNEQKLGYKPDVKNREIKSARYPEMSINVSVNKNLMDFYNTYPSSCIDNNFITRWAMYANTPLDSHIKEQIYPTLKQKLAGLSELEAVNRLLNMVQTGFVYEYDDKVWGDDRAFFAEESLYYPYCDCEDRSILFTRLVRDLLGLECVLIYYPGHLAAAVHFTSAVPGDYFYYANKRFTVTDPTYIGAPVGSTMTGMDNASATFILLE